MLTDAQKQASQFWLAMSPHYALFPVWSPENPNHPATTPDSEKSRGKLPAVPAWQHTPIPNTPTAQAALLSTLERYGNAGIALAKHQLVIDVDTDPTKNKRGAGSFAKLQKDLNIDLTALATAITITGSGGMHLFFALPPSSATNTAIKLRKQLAAYPDIDFLSHGHYALAPYSLHRNGNRYIPHAGKTAYDSLAEAPAELLDLLTYDATPKDHYHDATAYNDTPSNINRAALHIRSYPPAIQGQNGDDMTFRAAAICKDYGISPLAAYHVLNEAYNPRCVPQWTMPELQQKVRNAYEYTSPDAPRATESLLHGFRLVDTQNQSALRENTQTHGHEPLTTPEEILNSVLLVTDNRTWQNRITINQRTQQPQASHLQNLVTVLTEHPSFARMIGYNRFAEQPYLTRPAPWINRVDNDAMDTIDRFPRFGRPWSDQDTDMLRLVLAETEVPDMGWTGFETSRLLLEDAIRTVAALNSFHPVKILLGEAAAAYDGKPRLRSWLTRVTGCADNAYTRRVSECMLLAIVARVFDAESTLYHQIVVLEGAEGMRKSTFCETLAVYPEWYNGTPFELDDNRRFAESVTNKLVFEFPEIDHLARFDDETVKRVLSTKTISNVRLAYARHVTSIPVQCVFIGSTNELEYIKATSTTARRWWPIACEKTMDIDWLQDNLLQLYGEAMLVYMAHRTKSREQRRKEPLILDLITEEEKELATVLRDSRRENNMLKEAIERWVNGSNMDKTPYTVVRTQDILRDVFGQTDISTRSMAGVSRQIGAVMRLLGWRHGRAYTKAGVQVRIWVDPTASFISFPSIDTELNMGSNAADKGAPPAEQFISEFDMILPTQQQQPRSVQ